MPSVRRDYRRAIERTPNKFRWWPMDVTDGVDKTRAADALGNATVLDGEANITVGNAASIIEDDTASTSADTLSTTFTRIIASAATPDFNNPHSIELWCKPWEDTVLSTTQYYGYCTGPNFYIRGASGLGGLWALIRRTDATNYQMPQVAANRLPGNHLPQPGERLHLVTTYGGKALNGSFCLYLNGELANYAEPDTNPAAFVGASSFYLPSSGTPPVAGGSSDWQHVAFYNDDLGPEMVRWHYRVGIGAEDVDLTIGDALWRIVQVPALPATLDGSQMITHKGHALDLSDAVRDGVVTADEQLLTKLLDTGFFQLQT